MNPGVFVAGYVVVDEATLKVVSRRYTVKSAAEAHLEILRKQGHKVYLREDLAVPPKGKR